jgi:ferric-dicitrate binding protein FerR (iron transport regulator)
MDNSRIFELYIQYLSDSLTEEEARQVDQWLQEDENFRQQWQQLEEEGKQLDATSYLEKIDSVAALQRIKFGRKKSNIGYKFLAAASLLLLISAGAWWLFNKPKSHKIIAAIDIQQPQAIKLVSEGGVVELNKDSAEQTISLKNAVLTAANGKLQYSSADTSVNTLTIPEGQSYKINLSDGTEVWLNAATKLRFPFAFGSRREVYIEGEAFFKVAKDAARPFIVNTPLTTIQVLGTSFNVNTYHAGKVQTALVDGRVKTNNKQGMEEDLKPGVMATYNQNSGFTTGRFDEEELLSWREGIYYYHKIPLGALLEEASRFYGIKFSVNMEEANEKYITGLMDRNRLDDFLSDLQTTAKINFTVQNKEIIVRL